MPRGKKNTGNEETENKTSLVSLDETKEAYADTKELASEIGVKTIYDELSSDVAHFYKTGIRSLDIVFGGGVPSGKVIECYGWESCLTEDTEIPLLSGEDVKIKDLVGRDEFWVYSCTPEGKIIPGHGHSARITKTVNELYEITLDNDKKVRCTTDHRWMMRDGTYKRAYDLKIGDSLMPLYQRIDEKGYLLVKRNTHNSSSRWDALHRIVYTHINGAPIKGYHVHHIDKNRLNNSPENLLMLSPGEHSAAHPEKTDIELVTRLTTERNYKNWQDPAYREKMSEMISESNKGHWQDPEYQKKMSAVSKKTWESDEFRDKMMDVLKEASKKRWSSEESRNIQSDITKSSNNELGEFVCEKCRKSFHKKASYYAHQRAHSPNINHSGRQYALAANNHKIKDIQLIKVEDTPVYDITVDEYNNFALSAGCFVHNSGKSALSLTFSKAFTDYWKARDQKCVVLWIEAESAFDKMRARYFGCDLNRYMIMEAIDVEDAFQKMENAILKAQEKDIKLFVVLDTIAALQTTKERESGQFGGGIAEKPRVIKNCLRKLVPLLGQTDTTLVLVNQVYTTLGSYVPSSESPGGGGIKFFSSIRANVTMKKKDVQLLPSGEEVTRAIMTEIFTKKNKITLPQQKALIYLYGDRGIDPMMTAYEYMAKNKLFKGTAWKTYSSQRMLDGQVVDFEIKFQNVDQLKDKAEAESINILDYFDYEVTKIYSSASPFIKVKLIDDLWEFEETHFGERKSTLTEEEKELAKLIFEKITEDDIADDDTDEAFSRVEEELGKAVE